MTVASGDAVVCTFTNTRKDAAIVVTKTPSPVQVAEPGGNVTYSVTVKNTSSVDKVTVTSTSFTDKIGNGPVEPVAVDCNGGAAGDGLPQTLDPDQEILCTFVKAVAGAAGATIHDVVEVTGKDESNRDVKDDDDADVTITDTPSALEVVKTADPAELDEGLIGAAVTYTVTVQNTSVTDKVTVDEDGFVDKVEVNGDPADGVETPITNLDCDFESTRATACRSRWIRARPSPARSR